jgi:hypothetical protein
MAEKMQEVIAIQEAKVRAMSKDKNVSRSSMIGRMVYYVGLDK